MINTMTEGNRIKMICPADPGVNSILFSLRLKYKINCAGNIPCNYLIR